jgi:hypothetical protein
MAKPRSTVPNYSNKQKFGIAFKQAHADLGPGQKFQFNGKEYTTNCKDAGNYRAEFKTQLEALKTPKSKHEQEIYKRHLDNSLRDLDPRSYENDSVEEPDLN